MKKYDIDDQLEALWDDPDLNRDQLIALMAVGYLSYIRKHLDGIGHVLGDIARNTK